MIFWISAGIYFLLAVVFFCSYYNYSLPKEKMIQKKRFRKRRPLLKEAAERIVERSYPIYRKKAQKAKGFGISVTVLLVLESVIIIGQLVFANGAYSKIEVCVWENETLGTSVDPVSFMNEVEKGSIDGSEDGQEGTSGTADGESPNPVSFMNEAGKGSIDGSEDSQEGTSEAGGSESVVREVAGGSERDALQGKEDDIEMQEDLTAVDDQGNSEAATGGNPQGDNQNAVTVGSGPDSSGETKEQENDEKRENTVGRESSNRQESGENSASIGMTIEDNADDDEVTEGDKTDSISYDFSPLRLWGPYEFGERVTGQDLINMQNMVDEYFANMKYMDMFEEILGEMPEPTDEDYGDYDDVLERIEEFKSEKESNPDLLSASKYFANTKDRLFLYKENRNNNVLEQAAISAESAVEEEQLGSSKGYANYINYDRTGIVTFCYVLGLDLEEYDSGTKGDVKYRIGKLMYKPAANMVHIIFNDKCYALCSSYIILGDVFENWSPEQKYAVEIPFYYLSVCRDLLDIMEPGEARKEVCINAVNAYYRFMKSGEANPDNSTYVKYAADAYEKQQYAETVYASEILGEQEQMQDENNTN